MPMDLIYVMQRKTIMRYMHRQVNKLYLYEANHHPYLRNPYELRPLYVYRMQELCEMLEQCRRTQVLSEDIMQRILFEFATNPHGQMKFLYSDLVTFRTLIEEYPAQNAEQLQAQINATLACVQNLMPRIPDIMPAPEAAVQQKVDMQEIVSWQMNAYSLNIQDIIRKTQYRYLDSIMHTHTCRDHHKAPHISEYLMNLYTIIFSSLQLLHKCKYPTNDASIVYWCCMYLRYCAPGFLDVSNINNDAYRRTDNVLSILHNEWKYLQNKYPTGGIS